MFHADWNHFKAPDQLWVPGIKGQDGRWITLHPKALKAMGAPKASGPLFDRWETLAAFREAVYKKAKRERLHGVRFHETKHTGISALLEAGYSIPEVCKISGNSPRTITHYAHVNEHRAFERWKSFEYGGGTATGEGSHTTVQPQEVRPQKPDGAREPQRDGGGKERNVSTVRLVSCDGGEFSGWSDHDERLKYECARLL